LKTETEENEMMNLKFATEESNVEDDDDNKSSVIVYEKSKIRRKKEREMLGSEIAVTPVRRSVRLSSSYQKSQQLNNNDQKQFVSLSFIRFFLCFEVKNAIFLISFFCEN
jgi:hypothetical protein